jgi:hypothetical protein
LYHEVEEEKKTEIISGLIQFIFRQSTRIVFIALLAGSQGRKWFYISEGIEDKTIDI